MKKRRDEFSKIIAARYKSINIPAERFNAAEVADGAIKRYATNVKSSYANLRCRCKKKYATSFIVSARRYADRKVVSSVKIRRTF